MNKLSCVRDAIIKTFGHLIHENPEEVRQIVEDATYSGHEDPGEWAPSAHVIIHCENGIPSGMYNELYDKWFEVSQQLNGMYCEHINAAVIAVWDS